ncbi:MAG: Asp23/Gls24 family envelope stress response protein [Candidatus Omnitrophica bacterium]|nr:Asp23/Gls24 family envelope stress response protein [Candidatus Omnitrophota bacterium]
MDKNTKTELGEIRIHHNVFASIATEATKQVLGVIKIGGNLKTHLLELLGIKSYTAIRIEFDKNNEVVITVPIVVKYGYNIPDVASKVQEVVKLSIENSTNVSVKEINVKIQEIEKSHEQY